MPRVGVKSHYTGTVVSKNGKYYLQYRAILIWVWFLERSPIKGALDISRVEGRADLFLFNTPLKQK